MASNSAMQQSSSTSSLQGFNKRKTSGFNMDALNDALKMGSTEQLELPSVENDFDLENLTGSQDQLSSSPLTSGSTNGNNTKELKFEQKKVTSSQKTKVSCFSRTDLFTSLTSYFRRVSVARRYVLSSCVAPSLALLMYCIHL